MLESRIRIRKEVPYPEYNPLSMDNNMGSRHGCMGQVICRSARDGTRTCCTVHRAVVNRSDSPSPATDSDGSDPVAEEIDHWNRLSPDDWQQFIDDDGLLNEFEMMWAA